MRREVRPGLVIVTKPKIERDAVEPKASISEKVAYVKSQGQTRTHECHWIGCERQVPPAQWGCRAHWLRLPKRIQNRIWKEYEIGQEISMTPSEGYLSAADEAQQWIMEHAL